MNFKLLVGFELGVARQERQLAVSVILYTYFRLAFHDGPELFIVHLVIILAPTRVASVGADNELRLHLSGSDDNSLADDNGTNFIRSEVTDAFLMYFGARAVHDGNIAGLIHAYYYLYVCLGIF